MTAATKLRELLALTPASPAGDTEPTEVVAMAKSIVDTRAAYITELKALMAAGAPFDDDAARARDELLMRDGEWEAALARARYRIQERAGAARRMRQRCITTR